MRLLLTNDDGFYSPGLLWAARALRDAGEVVVCAPDREQSGVGTALTLHSPLRVQEAPFPLEGVSAFLVEGTPADSVVLALEKLVPGRVDLVVSGINLGSNLGEDVLVSGTVGGALQGAVRGIPSLAVSLTTLQDPHYETACRVLSLLVRAFRDGAPFPPLLNVNVPNLGTGEIEGVEVTRLGPRTFLETVQEGKDDRRPWFWLSRRRAVGEPQEGTDLWAVRTKRVSLTPLQANLTPVPDPSSLTPVARSLAEALGLPR